MRICSSRNRKFGSTFEPHFDINRSITLGDLVLEEKGHDKLEPGVLDVILPKVENSRYVIFHAFDSIINLNFSYVGIISSNRIYSCTPY
jgi:hypothetical protein